MSLRSYELSRIGCLTCVQGESDALTLFIAMLMDLARPVQPGIRRGYILKQLQVCVGKAKYAGRAALLTVMFNQLVRRRPSHSLPICHQRMCLWLMSGLTVFRPFANVCSKSPKLFGLLVAGHAEKEA